MFPNLASVSEEVIVAFGSSNVLKNRMLLSISHERQNETRKVLGDVYVKECLYEMPSTLPEPM